MVIGVIEVVEGGALEVTQYGSCLFFVKVAAHDDVFICKHKCRTIRLVLLIVDYGVGTGIAVCVGLPHEYHVGCGKEFGCLPLSKNGAFLRPLLLSYP